MKNELKAIDFFCSGGGMTCGLRLAGINVLAGIDNDPSVKDTYEKNNPGTKFINADIFKFSTEELSKETGIQPDDDNLILIGCSPCQYWSIIRTDKTKSKMSKDLLKEFHRFVMHFRPGYVVVENVPGLEKKSSESGLDGFIADLEALEYKVSDGVYDLSKYGVPQTRKRFSLIATRVNNEKIVLQTDETVIKVKDVIGERNGFPVVASGNKDLSDFQHTVSKLSEENLNVLKATEKNGGDSVKVRKSYQGKGFRDSYSRMSWDRPAPTITTRFNSISNGRFAHPEEDRGLSLREGATLQTFPKDYVFYSKSMVDIAKMIGNAVPPEFGRRIGAAISVAYDKDVNDE